MDPEGALPANGTETDQRIRALVGATCHALQSGVPDDSPDTPRNVYRRLRSTGHSITLALARRC